MITSSDANFDTLLKGMVRAYWKVLEIQPEIILEETDPDEVSERDLSS